MWIAKDWKDYELLTAAAAKAGALVPAGIGAPPIPRRYGETDKTTRLWRGATGRYSRSSTGGGHWDKGKLPESWQVHYKDLTFQVKPMNFKHTGLFPGAGGKLGLRHGQDTACRKAYPGAEPVCLYRRGYGSLCEAGASECHVDAAKGWWPG